MKSKKNCSNRDLTPKAISTEILKDQIFKKYFHSQLKKTDGKICSSFKEMYGACLEWNGNKNASGYGFIQVPQRLVKRLKRKAIGLYVHRLSYNFANPESVLEGFSPQSMKGAHNAYSLLFPMEAVFESFVAKYLKSNLHLYLNYIHC